MFALALGMLAGRIFVAVRLHGITKFIAGQLDGRTDFQKP